MAQVPGFSTISGAAEANTGTINPLGTYEDPQSGVRETAVMEAQADAYVRLGWVKTATDDKIVSSREQILGALDLTDTEKQQINVGPKGPEELNGNTSAEGRAATDAAAAEQAANASSKKDGK